MGIRFKCHLCESPLNVKSELASKRGVCPKCKGKFRIPSSTQEYSLELVEAAMAMTGVETTEVSSKETLQQGEPASAPISTSTTALVSRVAETPKSVSPPPTKPAQAAPTEAAEAFYFVRPPSGGEYGPAAKSTIEDWITQRRVTPDTMVCKLGTEEWLKAKDVFVMKFLFP